MVKKAESNGFSKAVFDLLSMAKSDFDSAYAKHISKIDDASAATLKPRAVKRLQTIAGKLAALTEEIAKLKSE